MHISEMQNRRFKPMWLTERQVSPHTAQDAIFQININKVPMKKNKSVTNGLALLAEYGFVLIH